MGRGSRVFGCNGSSSALLRAEAESTGPVVGAQCGARGDALPVPMRRLTLDLRSAKTASAALSPRVGKVVGYSRSPMARARNRRMRPVSYLLFADSHTYVCRTWDDLVRRLLWARAQGCVKAKARFANADIDRPLMPSEQARLVEAATARFMSERWTVKLRTAAPAWRDWGRDPRSGEGGPAVSERGGATVGQVTELYPVPRRSRVPGAPAS